MATQTIQGAAVEQGLEEVRPLRIGFRFVFVYFGIYCLLTQIFTSLLPLANVDIPDVGKSWPIRLFVVWSGTHMFHTAKPPGYVDTGSGDTHYDWILLFWMLVLAAVATAIWTALDRKCKKYEPLSRWFRLCMRFCLAGQMMSYGLNKVIPLQMPFPGLYRLVETYGNLSPMGVLWASIGSAPAYEVFAGCAELLGGVLLVFPRTTTLGALICLADMVQVFMLNMTYDVPVKLLSFHLILLSLVLLGPDFSRLCDFFFSNRSAEAPSHRGPFTTPRAMRISFVAQIIFGLWLFGANLYAVRAEWFKYGAGQPKSELYGIWDVDQMVVDGQERSALVGDYERWRRLIFEFPTRMTFQRMDGSLLWYGAAINTQDNTLAVTKFSDQKWKANFTFRRESQGHLVLDGTMDGHKLHMEMKLMDRNKFLLVNRGFHWIQDFPFNR